MNPRVSRSSALASQGDRVPDRQDRRSAGGWLHAAGDHQRHHPGNAGELRAGDRLLRREVAAVRVREVPRRRAGADHAHEVGGRGDGDRAHVQAGVRQGAALARARLAPEYPSDDGELLMLVSVARPRALRPPAGGAASRCTRSRSCNGGRASTRGSCASWPAGRERRRGGIGVRPGSADLQVGRHLRGRVRCAYPLLLLVAGSGPVAAVGAGKHEVDRGQRASVVILGSGPNRIGQGIEFDYCCVHAAQTVRESGRDAVMINCNPETVSTDYDTSDRLYFEPLTLEDVLGVCEVEQPEGVVVQFGGQTPLKLAAGLRDAGIPILGTTHRRDRPGGGSCALRSAARPARLQGAAVRVWLDARRRRWRGPRRSASRCWCAPATCSVAARWRSSTASTACANTSSGWA